MIIKVLLKRSHFTLESSKGLCFKDGVQDGCHNFSYSPFYELMMQLKYGVFPLSFQVYTPRSLVALAVKEVAKVYRFYDQDAFSFVRNIDYYPLTITDLAPPEFHVTDDSKINLLQEAKMERMLLSAKKFLMKRRRAVNAIFDTIAKMIVNFRNKEEVDELDLKRLRVKTVKYLEIMDLLDSVGIEVELEDMLEEMISHIQQHRFRAKLLNLFLNQSYLRCGEKVEDVEPVEDSQGDDMKTADEESDNQKGEEKIGDGLLANERKHKEVVHKDRTENEKVVDTDLVVRDNVDSTEDWIIIESADIIACAANHQEEVNEERTEKETEKTDFAFRCEIESPEDRVIRDHGGITDDIMGKVIEEVEKTDLTEKNDIETVDNKAVSVTESSTAYHQKEKVNEEKETITNEINNGSPAKEDSENSAGGTAGIGGCSIEDSFDQQKELNEERVAMEEVIEDKLKSEKEDIKDDHTDNVENTTQAFEIGDNVEPSEDEVKREDGDIIDDHKGTINQGKNEEEKIEKVEDVKETLCDQASTITVIECPIANNENQDRVGNENSEACRALEDVIEPAGDGASIADQQNEGGNVIVKNEGEKTELAVGEIVESAGDCPGDILVNIDNMEKESEKEIEFSEIKVTVEKEETGLAVGNKGCPCGDGVKVEDKPNKDSQEQLGCTDENNEVNGEMKLVVKDERFCIHDEKYGVFVLYGMVRCS